MPLVRLEFRVSRYATAPVKKESKMRFSRTLLLLSVLVSGVFNVFGQASDPPKLPDQYAEAVLQVEGMI